MVKTFSLTLLLIVVLSTHFFAFTAEKSTSQDSLQQVLKNTNLTDSLRIDVFNQLGKLVYLNDPALTESSGREALQMAEKLQDQKRIGISQQTIGYAKFMQSDYDSAIIYFNLARQKFEAIQSYIHLAGVLNSISVCYMELAQYQQSLEILLQSLEVAETYLTEKETVSQLMNIAGIHDYLKDYDKAIEYYQQAINLAEKYDNHLVLRNSFNNLGTIYKQIGPINKAIQYHEKALQVGLDNNNRYGVSASYNNLGVIYKNLNQFDKAKDYYLKSLAIKSELGDKRGMATLLLNIGSLQVKLKNYDSAKVCYLNALTINQKTGGLNDQITTLLNLSQVHELTGNDKTALDYYKKYHHLNDSVFNLQKSQQVNELQTQYETEKKESEIVLLQTKTALQEAEVIQQRNTKNLALLASGLFFLLILFAFQRYRQKQQLKLIEAEKIQELDRVKSNFFANISHEFRTPLTLIKGSLYKLIKNDGLQANDLQQEFKMMHRNTERLLQLINQLLELSKLDAGKASLQAEKVEITSYVKRIAMAFASYADNKQLLFLFNKQPLASAGNGIGVPVYIDPDKMDKILYNLLFNAIKFTPEKGEINVEVNLEEDGKGVEILVSNTGEGINPDKLPYIFNRFYQADSNSTRKYEGTGIGLALVKELVELHGGQVTAESIPDEVTTFRLQLPLGKAHLQEDQIIQAQSGLPEEPQSAYLLADDSPVKVAQENIGEDLLDQTLILVVEDHFDLRKFIAESLPGYKILEAANGKEALPIAREHIPDLIVSDLMMPEMDGIALCQALKTNEKTDHIPVILLTAKADQEHKMKGLETGADDYLLKPFNPEELQARVKNLIRIRQNLRKKFTDQVDIKPANITVSSSQKVFLQKLMDILENHMEKESFGVEELGQEIAMSRAQLHRKIKAITNQSPSEFIRKFRLQRAAELIKQDAGNLAEIAYQVGFSSQAYFTRSFQEVYGCTPSEFKKQNSTSV